MCGNVHYICEADCGKCLLNVRIIDFTHKSSTVSLLYLLCNLLCPKAKHMLSTLLYLLHPSIHFSICEFDLVIKIKL